LIDRFVERSTEFEFPEVRKLFGELQMLLPEGLPTNYIVVDNLIDQ
jgi:hypothetical protein